MLWKTQAVFSPSPTSASCVFFILAFLFCFQHLIANHGYHQLQILHIFGFHHSEKNCLLFLTSYLKIMGKLSYWPSQVRCPPLNKSTVGRDLSFCGNHVDDVVVNGAGEGGGEVLEGQESRRKGYCSQHSISYSLFNAGSSDQNFRTGKDLGTHLIENSLFIDEEMETPLL